jgi:hypothetical protein
VISAKHAYIKEVRMWSRKAKRRENVVLKRSMIIILMGIGVVVMLWTESSALRLSNGGSINIGSLICDGSVIGISANDCPLDASGEPTCTVSCTLNGITAEASCVTPGGQGVFPGRVFLPRTTILGQDLLSDTHLAGKGKEPLSIELKDEQIRMALEDGGACQNRQWKVATAQACSDGAEREVQRGLFIITETRMTFLITQADGTKTQQSWTCKLDPRITLEDNAPLCPEDFDSPYTCTRVR